MHSTKDAYIRIHAHTHIHTIALRCIALHYITLHCITSHYKHYIHYITIPCIALPLHSINSIALQYITLHYIELHGNTWHYIAVHCIALQYINCITLHCIILHCITISLRDNIALYITLHFICMHTHTHIYIYVNIHKCRNAYVSNKWCPMPEQKFWSKSKGTRNATRKGDLKAGSVPYNACFAQPLQCGATCCLSGKHGPNEWKKRPERMKKENSAAPTRKRLQIKMIPPNSLARMFATAFPWHLGSQKIWK